MDWIITKIKNLIILPVLDKIPEFIKSILNNRSENKFVEKMNEVQYKQKQNLIRENNNFQIEYQKEDHDSTKKLEVLKKNGHIPSIIQKNSNSSR